MRLYDKACEGSSAVLLSVAVDSSQDVQAANELLHSGEAALKVALKAQCTTSPGPDS